MTNPLDSMSSSSSGLTVNGESAGYLKETGGWARFLAIVGFVFLGLFAIGMFFVGGIMSAVGLGSQVAGMEVVLGIFFFIFVVLTFFPCFFLIRFAGNITEAVRQNDQTALVNAFRYLKSYYRFVGVLTAIFVALYVLSILGRLAM